MRKRVFIAFMLCFCFLPFSVSASTYEPSYWFIEENSTGNPEEGLTTEDPENTSEDTTEDEENSSENTEDPVDLQDGAVDFTQEQDTYATNNQQTYYFSYLGNEKTYESGVVIFRFGRGFTPSTLQFGDWEVNESEQILEVTIKGYSGKVEKYKISSYATLTSLETIGEIESIRISCEGIGIYQISDLELRGTLGSVDSVYAFASFDAYIGNDLVFQDEKELNTKRIYYQIPAPSISFLPHTVKYGEDAEITISNMKGNGSAHLNTYSFYMKIPKSIRLSEVYLPEMEDAQIKAYLNGVEIESGIYDESGMFSVEIIPISSSFRQLSDIKLVVTNRTSEDKTILLNGKVHATFSDLDDIRLSRYSDTVFLKEKKPEKEEEEIPTEPTEPTEPTGPTEPSEPTKPVTPTEPTKPVQPSEPTETDSSENTDKEEKKTKKEEKKEPEETEKNNNLLENVLDNTKQLIKSVGNKLTTGTVEEVQAKTKEEVTSSEATTEDIAEEVEETKEETIKKKTNEIVQNNRGIQSLLIIFAVVLAGILSVSILFMKSLNKEDKSAENDKPTEE